MVFGAILTLGGCMSTNLHPDYVSLGRYDMMEVSANTPVALINLQQPGMSTIKMGQTDMETDLSLWSAQAVASIGNWLKTYDVHLSPEAVVKLKVSIVEPSFNMARHLPCARLSLKIQTESGITKLYPVEGCAATNNRAIGYAISYAVMDMIRDREITDYIEDRKSVV